MNPRLPCSPARAEGRGRCVLLIQPPKPVLAVVFIGSHESFLMCHDSALSLKTRTSIEPRPGRAFVSVGRTRPTPRGEEGPHGAQEADTAALSAHADPTAARGATCRPCPRRPPTPQTPVKEVIMLQLYGNPHYLPKDRKAGSVPPFLSLRVKEQTPSMRTCPFPDTAGRLLRRPGPRSPHGASRDHASPSTPGQSPAWPGIAQRGDRRRAGVLLPSGLRLS